MPDRATFMSMIEPMLKQMDAVHAGPAAPACLEPGCGRPVAARLHHVDGFPTDEELADGVVTSILAGTRRDLCRAHADAALAGAGPTELIRELPLPEAGEP